MTQALPVLALLFNALVWGLSWWPFRAMQAQGLHPLWATGLMYSLITLGLLLWRPATLRQSWGHAGLWLLALCSGLNNITFNWAVSIGDVVRVILLFYLMPAWAVLLAWRLLGERPTRAALGRLVLAFGGVLLVLWSAEGGAARLASALGLADVLALLGGFMFGLTNVLLRRLREVPGPARMLAMFAGCMVLGLASAATGQALGALPGLPDWSLQWAGIALVLALLFMAGNGALQYGAARLPTGTTAVVLLSEVLFASLSSVLLASATLEPRTLLGGVCIVLAALLAALERRG